MVAGIEPIQVGVLTAIAIGFGYIWLVAGRGEWYERLSERFIYAVPWGTLVSIVGVVAFYLFAQSGLSHWESPVTVAFRSWSYFYPEGLLAAGFAHAGPGHLTGNMIGTLVLAPIVEYAWSHYPPAVKQSEYEFPPPGDVDTVERAGMNENNRYRDRPWVRAFIIFPAVIFAVSILTSVLAFGWSLGFSGTVFAFGGFAVIYFPVAAIIAMVGFTGTAIVINTLLDPILRATAETGAPGPPSWWGINIQAHLLGFLIGVLLALALLKSRDERRKPMLVFFATVLFGLSRGLYIFSASGGEDVFLQLRGVGVIFVLGLAVLVTATVAAGENPLPDALRGISWLPTTRLVSLAWTGAVVLLGWAVWAGTIKTGNIPILGVGIVPVLLLLFLFPFFPKEVERVGSTLSRRSMFIFALVIILVVVAIPSIASNYPGMDENPVPGEASITIEDYVVTYAEDAAHGRVPTNGSGVIVISEQRRVWSSVVDKDELSHDGVGTAVVGGVGWRETVVANRTGWDATGSETAYVVDLEHDDETVRAFTSEPAEARATIAGKTITVEPGDQFRLNVTENGTLVGKVAIPPENGTVSVDTLEFSAERDDGTLTVFAMEKGTRVQIAQQEEFD